MVLSSMAAISPTVFPLLLSMSVKLHQGVAIGLETVLLNEERHQDAVDVENEIVGIRTVKHIVVEQEGDLPPYAVRLAQSADLIDFFASDHPLVIFAPRAFRRSSICS